MSHKSKGIAVKIAAKIAARERRVRKMVVAAGLAGISTVEIVSRMNVSADLIRKHLAALAERGEVENSHGGGTTNKWGPPGIRSAYAHDRERIKIQREDRAARRKAALEGSSQSEVADGDDGFARHSFQARVSALEAVPISVRVPQVVLAPNSVFQLGDMHRAAAGASL